MTASAIVPKTVKHAKNTDDPCSETPRLTKSYPESTESREPNEHRS